MANIFNTPAPGISYFTPAQIPASGTLDPAEQQKPILFTPIKIRGLEFQNRIFLSPMCQYSAEDGHMTAWHMAHLGGIFTRGPSLSIIEATADSQIEPMRKIVEFAHSQNQKIAIQLAHAGRKASTMAPWLNPGIVATEEQNGWPDDVWGPSAIPFHEQFPKPKALTKEGIERVKTGFVQAAKRALKVGFDVIEIHGAHGYLLSSFLSPQCNMRTDEYGGSFENRIRLLLEIVDAIRAVMPPTMPLFVRISASDWLEGVVPDDESWRTEDTVKLAGILAEHGVDFLDVSSGGNSLKRRKVKAVSRPYQAHFAEAVKKAHGDKIIVGSVGGFDNGKVAEEVLQANQADVILVGSHFQKNPGAVWQFADDLGVSIHVAHQIEWGFRGRKKGVDR
ncbi:FMN-linked oxidoreductase [Heliocybe sulcata]|uniref:FMN-linked oxidoreductase n=1 Tax=Heliocybe sulcata TaxID=5364 RepID=A0A5C3MVH3_9AGAM|nr:FMN-linked oxidoreductase [Heliocybe sulcata]